MDIPKIVSDISDEGTIPNSVAELSVESEAPEIYPYVISFAKYNHKMCQLSDLSGNKPRKAIEVLKKIGTKVCCQADFQTENIDRIPIRREGAYKQLYNRLNDDIDLKEIKLQQDARIFYFDIESERTLYIVAITENHLETGKVRR